MPLFNTEPTCDLTNADLDYKVTRDLPNFLTFDPAKRAVTANAVDESLLGKTVKVTM